jgi:3'-phosphoadenosine 5'-phosphosulfate (PAPS) 3'-phosphatase
VSVASTNSTTLNTARVWVFDPIDGTSSFIVGGHYGICVALLVDRQNTVNVVGWPRHSRALTGLPFDGPAIFAAARGKGVRAFDSAGRSWSVTVGEARPILAFSGGSRAMIDEEKRRLGLSGDVEIVSMVKGLVVATGGASMYVRYVGAADDIWDCAPVELIVREAGGSVTGVGGGAVVFTEGAMAVSGSGLNVFTS